MLLSTRRSAVTASSITPKCHRRPPEEEAEAAYHVALEATLQRALVESRREDAHWDALEEALALFAADECVIPPPCVYLGRVFSNFFFGDTRKNGSATRSVHRPTQPKSIRACLLGRPKQTKTGQNAHLFGSLRWSFSYCKNNVLEHNNNP